MARMILVIMQVAAFGLLMACSGKASSKNQQEETAAVTNASGDDDGLVGEWEQILTAGDTNGNGTLEDEERKSGHNNLKDYMKLNSDGSAIILIVKAKGRYEINEEKSSGKKYLNLFSEDGTKYRKGAIVSVGKTELLLMNKFGGSSFTVWKRL